VDGARGSLFTQGDGVDIRLARREFVEPESAARDGATRVGRCSDAVGRAFD
jgi:hypothetical protein